VSRYQKGKTSLDFTKARDSEWQWNQLGRMPVCTLLQTDNHASTPSHSFYRLDALPATHPTASINEGRGVGTTGALAPAMLKPRRREYLFARAIFSHIFACCSLNFHSLSLCCLHTIKTSGSVGTTGRILRNKLTKHTSPGVL